MMPPHWAMINIQSLHKLYRGITLVIVTHDKAVTDICRRVITLEDGVIINDSERR
jgi:ABC-type lipoprotein export system ATPase subunit